ncbi:hypothetical protein L1987_23434 [Smallanthus sonchifolius]|uniref:Uncharacterized protein n=1 Tax=Smallanthus sonchifolius TaxID=185202 RepID=A0ACB9IGX2_9ASTR|nr:hypothetical protein L1987_23434 [Smallanthus sonchifolius]
MLSISPAISRIYNLSDRPNLHCHHYNRQFTSYRPPPPPPSSHLRAPKTVRLRQNFQISAIDSAQPFDYESKLSNRIAKSKTLKISTVGFDNFDQFLAKTFVYQGHTVLAHSRTDYSTVAAVLCVSFYSNADDLFEEHPEIILLCTSILDVMQNTHVNNAYFTTFE